jgi:hypothetical protein
MSTALTIIRVLKWLSTLALVLTAAAGAALIDRRFTMLMLPPFFMQAAASKASADGGSLGHRLLSAEASRGLGQQPQGSLCCSAMWATAAQRLRPSRTFSGARVALSQSQLSHGRLQPP